MSATLLSCRGLAVHVGQRCLVRDLDLQIGVGERWALVGPNGAGKSSLLLVLAGARRAHAGTVTIGGRPVADWPISALAQLRAFVADRWTDAFATTVQEVVLAGRYRFAPARGLTCCAGLAGADAAAAALPHVAACLAAFDCAPLAARDVRSLSRGERQRVALAAALAQETPLLLVDEPISHQDPRHQVAVLQCLRDQSGRSCIAALHDMNAAARFATHALLLSGEGAWIAGTAATVLTPETLAPLFGTAITQLSAGLSRWFVLTAGVAPTGA